MIIDEAVYLEHFGVKGMHWGVRHEPPRGRGGRQISRKERIQRKRLAKGQKSIDRLRRLESNRGSKSDAFIASMLHIPINEGRISANS